MEMFYYVWLFAAALTGWSVGKITRQNGVGAATDILLGLTGAFLVRWSFENVGLPLEQVYMLLFSIWGAAAFPAAMRLGIGRYNRSKARSRPQSD
jgi:uncharacterized membrane protein YeaQ/YmgE (transglycosylase-associated protein family)